MICAAGPPIDLFVILQGVARIRIRKVIRSHFQICFAFLVSSTGSVHGLKMLVRIEVCLLKGCCRNNPELEITQKHDIPMADLYLTIRFLRFFIFIINKIIIQIPKSI